MKKLLHAGIASVFLLSTAGCSTLPTKKWVEDKISQYEEKDKDWTKKIFQEDINQEQLEEAYNSTYLVMNMIYYKTQGGQEVANVASGSGLLLKGNYFLTAKHVIKPPLEESVYHPYLGPLTLSRTELSLTTERPKAIENYKGYGIEEIISGSNDDLDYTLLKVGAEGLPFYSKGLNLPDKVEIGMQSLIVGFPMQLNKNIRLGNVSQDKSDIGDEHHISFKNSMLPSDSGGPVFVIEDGDLKYTGIARAIIMNGQTGATYNINYATKVSSVIEDLEAQLASGNLDEKTSAQVEEFLELNK